MPLLKCRHKLWLNSDILQRIRAPLVMLRIATASPSPYFIRKRCRKPMLTQTSVWNNSNMKKCSQYKGSSYKKMLGKQVEMHCHLGKDLSGVKH